MGIPRANRLRRNTDFQRVRAWGRSWADRSLVLGVLSSDQGRVRVGITVSRRIGGAVVRARVRRLIREAVRPWLHEIRGGWDLVFIARTPLRSASFHDVDRTVAQLLRRAGLVTEIK
ncbi:MAG: ribonuclease P protein component [Anaerolineae bacterium]|jgi:ribonuclease P protein component